MSKFGAKRILHALRWRCLHCRHKGLSSLISVAALIITRLRFYRHRDPPLHNLPGQVIVSLTSYPPRFATLLPTLQCLLLQTVRPDRIILWVDSQDRALLPAAVLTLQERGIDIRTTKDTGPYKKIIPALREYKQAFIVTADDDVYYHPSWLSELIAEWDGSPNQIVCHRAHGITFASPGVPLPYYRWNFDIAGPVQSKDIFPTGIGGVLYPPGCFAEDVLDEEKFLILSPKADDVWLFWMGRLAGAVYRKTSTRMKHVLWPRSQKTALAQENYFANANDPKIAAMIEHYGWPS